MIDPGIALQIGTAAATVGAVWGTVRGTLNGTKEKMTEMNVSLSHHIEADHKVQTALLEGLTRVETKLDERTRPR